jgi:Rrf2 family protein
MLSQTAEYALRAVLAIARARGEAVGAAALAKQVGVPPSYLAKTLNALVRNGVLVGTRGRNGGFRLAKRPSQIALLDVVSPFDDIGPGRRCLLGRATCSDQNPCAAHARWRGVSQRIGDFFAETTVEDVSAGSVTG